MSDANTPQRISASERIRRREALDFAIANNRLAGLALAPEDRLILEQFVEGELTEEQLMDAILHR